MQLDWFKASTIHALQLYNEPCDKFSNKFQRDRDRILYSKSFRRLSGKTQVFLAGQNDHLRTRLTHSLEVNQIAKTISNALLLDLDLTEACALGHDIGHTPFGHIGERTLNYIMNGCDSLNDFNFQLPNELKGFKHNLQALRVLIDLESISTHYPGLNLTDQTLWGIANHTSYGLKVCDRTSTASGEHDPICYFNHKHEKCIQDGKLLLDFYDPYLKRIFKSNSWSVEGLVVKIADEIAQRQHDIEDSLSTGLLDTETIIQLINTHFKQFLSPRMEERFKELEALKADEVFSRKVSTFLQYLLISRLIIDSRENLKDLIIKYGIHCSSDFNNLKSTIIQNEEIDNLINFRKEFRDTEDLFHKFLKSRILDSYTAQKMDGKAKYIISQLFRAYVSNPQQLPDRTITFFFNNFHGKEFISELEKNNTSSNLISNLRSRLRTDFNREEDPRYKHALLRTICDYIAGMTDNYAYNQFELLYGSTRIFQ